MDEAFALITHRLRDAVIVAVDRGDEVAELYLSHFAFEFLQPGIRMTIAWCAPVASRGQ